MWHPTIPHLLAFSLRSSYWSHDGFDILDEPDTEFNLPGGGYNAPSNRRGGPSTSKFGCEYASQLYVYEGLGRGVLNNALNGFVSTIRAAVSPAATALCCDEIFKRKTDIEASGTTKLQVTFSMMEIYNEKIRDLLNPDPKTNNDLKVRTTPKGTYVEGTKAKAVGSFDAINREMEAGTASRTVAATQMNATSSRAHTVMAITVKQIISEDGRKKEIASDMNLVDLAGSERAESTGATGDRLKEGAAINKSLSSLGNVISALAEQANNPKKKVFVPYRDSKLTQILQSALGGNSKTIMVAALSPADINYEETLSTLRYADRAKQIKVVVEVQENPTDRLIRQLKEENEKLRKMMEQMGGDGFDPAAFAAAAGGGRRERRAAGGHDHRGADAGGDREGRLGGEGGERGRQGRRARGARAEMNARHEGLAHGMISRSNFEATLKDAINGTIAASDVTRRRRWRRCSRSVEARAQARAKPTAASSASTTLCAVLDEALRFLDGKVPDAELPAARGRMDEVLGASAHRCGRMGCSRSTRWLVIDADPARRACRARSPTRRSRQVQGARQVRVPHRAGGGQGGHALEERAVGDDGGAVVRPIGGDVKKAVVAAELRFDQLLRDAEDGAVDEGVMKA